MLEVYTTIPDFPPMVDDTLQRYKSTQPPLNQALQRIQDLQSSTSNTKELVPIWGIIVQWCPPEKGLVLLELFGGISTGLEAMLPADLRIAIYVYVDLDPNAREIIEGQLSVALSM